MDDCADQRDRRYCEGAVSLSKGLGIMDRFMYSDSLKHVVLPYTSYTEDEMFSLMNIPAR